MTGFPYFSPGYIDEQVCPFCAGIHRPGYAVYRLANLGPTAAFSVTLVGVSKYPTGLEVFTCIYNASTVTDVPIMPGKRSRSNFYYGVVGSEPDRKSLIREVVDYIAVARCDDWAAPISNHILALVGTLARSSRAVGQPTAHR